jgi:hypothetical protein
LPAWNAPPFKLYCKEPVPPVAVTVNVVDPPLHAIEPADADAEIADGSETVTADEVAVQAGVATSLAVTVYGEPVALTVNVFPGWKAPPFKLYSTEPIAPVAVAVSVVVPPLHAMVPAEAETAIEHAGP